MARQRERIRLEDGFKLDLNKLRVQSIPQGEPRERVICLDSRYSNGARTICFLICRLCSETRGSMRLLLRGLDQRIVLIGEPRHFGGIQWYFICPMTGRRASVLWMPPGASCFASRQAWGDKVAYSSQFETVYYRTLSRADQIRYRLSGDDYREMFFILPPPRPRYMRRKTYHAQLKRLRDTENTYRLLVKKPKGRSNKAIKRSNKV
jgi:hypothetical protein